MDLGFNPASLPDEELTGPRTLVPEGWHRVRVLGFEDKSILDDRVRLAEGCFIIEGGEHDGRRVWDSFCVASDRPADHEPGKWLEVSRKRIKMLGRACKVESFTDTDALLDKWLEIHVKHKERGGEMRTNVATYRPVGGWPDKPAAAFTRPVGATAPPPAGALVTISAPLANPHDDDLIPF